jgi:hypothetical protein
MSNRSLAAARSRRTPQEVVSEASMKKKQSMPPQKISPMTSSKDSPPSGSSQNKLSIGDAIGLITIRLSKLESHMLKEQNEPNTSGINSGSISDVDTLLRSLVSRITGLEKSSQSVEQTLEELDGAVKVLEENPQNQEVQTDPLLLERIDKAEREISELKQLVIRLQSMLIETTMMAKTQQTLITPPSPPLPPPQSQPQPQPQPILEESITSSMILEI